MPISRHDKQALAEVIIHLGVPLIRSITRVEGWSSEAQDTSINDKADKLARLLNICVSLTSGVMKKLEIRDQYMLEKTRGQVLRIVAPLVAQHYENAGTILEGDALSEYSDLLDVLISLSDSLNPIEDISNKKDSYAQFIIACAPVIEHISENPFQFETAATTKTIIEGLQSRAQEMSQALSVEDGTIYNNGMLEAVAQVFCESFNTLKAKSNTGHFSAQGDEALEALWQACDERLALIQSLGSLIGKNIGITPTQKTDKKVEKEPAKENNETKDFEIKDNDKIDNDNDDDDDESFDPMSFFSGGS